MDVTIKGADDLVRISKRLREAGEAGKGVKRELYRGLNRATKPLRAKAQAAAAADLPQSGGLAKIVSKPKGTVRIRTGRDPRLTIVSGKGPSRSTNAGVVRHPVFGNRNVWVVQQTPGAGWFTETMVAGAPTVQKELQAALDDVARKIDGGL